MFDSLHRLTCVMEFNVARNTSRLRIHWYFPSYSLLFVLLFYDVLFCDEQPLHWAAKHGNIPMLKRLLEFGASEPYKRMVKERAKSMAAQALSAGEKNGSRSPKKIQLDANQPSGGEQGTAEDKDGEPKEEAGGDSGASGNDPSGEGEKNAISATGSKVPGLNDVLAAAHEDGEEDDVEKLLETSGKHKHTISSPRPY